MSFLRLNALPTEFELRTRPKYCELRHTEPSTRIRLCKLTLYLLVCQRPENDVVSSACRFPVMDNHIVPAKRFSLVMPHNLVAKVCIAEYLVEDKANRKSGHRVSVKKKAAGGQAQL